MTTDKKERKETPITTGVLDYFPDAIAAVAHTSFVGNEQHNPGQPLHWAREKSTDHADCITRHLLERGKFDTDGVRHSAKAAWRSLANLQVEIESDRARQTATETAMLVANYDSRRDTKPGVAPGKYDATNQLRGRDHYWEVDEDQSMWFCDYAGKKDRQREPDASRDIYVGFIASRAWTFVTDEEFKHYAANAGATPSGAVPPSSNMGSVDSSSAGRNPTVGETPVANKFQTPTEPGIVAVFDRKDVAEDFAYLLRAGCDEEVAFQIIGGTKRGGVDQEQGAYFYIAGPMRGKPKFNFPSFDATRDLLVATGATVISPADIDRVAKDVGNINSPNPQPSGDNRRFVYRDFFALWLIAERGGYVIFLDGWEKSVGARAEYNLARWLGIACVVLVPGTTIFRMLTANTLVG